MVYIGSGLASKRVGAGIDVRDFSLTAPGGAVVPVPGILDGARGCWGLKAGYRKGDYLTARLFADAVPWE